MAKLFLPPPLASDERFSILADIAAERFARIDLTTLLVNLIDLVDASALPSLAEQFHVQGLEGWSFCCNEQEKRELIKQAIELHKYKGTPWAVRRVLEILSLPGSISEWFEYGGKPYFFKIDIELTDKGIDEDLFHNLIDIIHEYKNVRSKLESLIIWIINQSTTPVVGCALFIGENTTVRPFEKMNIIQKTPFYIGAGQWSLEITSIYPE
ncbi:TPA: phage tail protein I [Enterobacter cancerogenus]|jgi:phage tail P2-like protein|uniref:phage tail protein I n=1 Tax=Enterobacter cancerogenus TaxID=69218 RepID=UPI0001826DB5|nr:phage tail protein I [Enterobacter cancerogenus]EFC55316.1 phage tail protein I-like protein [Enterobacter cancerogenus ATCC 35316]KTQ46737.1 tail protein [Enterobacter cancerogenus]KTQ54113.1 tail protein [Enterobacter cancerogenus]KTQ68131.1 tail protein [Enterobacter cancerogenus]KTQ81483.1 tail protein [Enterobacter cancerogenus]